MDTVNSQSNLLLDLEARHEDVMRQLDELDQRVQKTLAEWQGCRASTQETPHAAVAG
jgi:tetrahydromethanopterin S-methyltransferase subunit G